MVPINHHQQIQGGPLLLVSGGYNTFKWPYTVNRYITGLRSCTVTLLITGRGPPTNKYLAKKNNELPTKPRNCRLHEPARVGRNCRPPLRQSLVKQVEGETKSQMSSDLRVKYHQKNVCQIQILFYVGLIEKDSFYELFSTFVHLCADRKHRR